MRQYQKTDRQSKRQESNLGSCRSPDVITTPYSQLLATVPLLAGNVAEEVRSGSLQGEQLTALELIALGGITAS